MENKNLTQQLNENPLIRELVKLTINSQASYHLLMAFLSKKIETSKDEQMRFFMEFKEFNDEHFKESYDHFLESFINSYNKE